jgi:hypothetical protein
MLRLEILVKSIKKESGCQYYGLEIEELISQNI